MLKRSLYSLFLVLALLFVQQAALWHGVSHSTTTANSQQDQKLPHAEQCEKCATFAHTGAAAAATPFHFALPQSANLSVHFIAPAIQLALHFAYQSRAPPVLA